MKCGNNNVASLSITRSVVTAGAMVLYITSKNATCGYGSGSIIVQVANGSPPYSYKMDVYPSQNTGNFPVAAAGIHTIVVTDASGSIATASVTLTNILPGPVNVIVAISTGPSDCLLNSGAISISASGGVAPYTYSMDLINYQSDRNFSNLHAGIYNVYVKDANGCIATNSIFLESRSCDALSITNSTIVCGANGIISVQDLNGNDPYEYSLDGIVYQNNGNFNNISAGINTIFIKDKAGNVKVFGLNAAEDCDLNLQYITVDAACMENNGGLTVSVANGTPPYSYSIDGVNYQAGNTFANLAPGNYYITAKDATGVTSSLEAAVYDKCPVVVAIGAGESCIGADGIITAGGFKGTAPYQYSLDGVNFQSNNVFTGMSAGTYTIYIRDALGFTGFTGVAVPDNCLTVSLKAVDATCGNPNGSITATPKNGTPPYRYSIDGIDFQTQNIFIGLIPGSYHILLEDSNSISATSTIVINNIQGPLIQYTVVGSSCLNDDGSISVQASGGTIPYQYAVDGGNFQDKGDFISLDTGIKIIVVKDSNSCMSSQKIVVPLSDNLTLNAGAALTLCQGTGVTLQAQSNGSTFSWSPSLGLNNPSLLSPRASPMSSTKYFITGMLGICVKTDSVSITVSDAPVANAGKDTTICYGKSSELNGSGGNNCVWSPATYLSNEKIYNPSVNQPSNSITYNLTVYDGNGCASVNSAGVNVNVTPLPKLFAGNDTSVFVDQSLQLHAVDLGNSGFTNYSWTPATGLNNSSLDDPIAFISNDIVYTVNATTPNGCEAKAAIAIKVFIVSGIFVPSAFTPNGDGRNDVLKPILRGMRSFKYFSVFSRWGQRVFYTADSGAGWDGTFKGATMESGGYVWMCEGIDYTGKLIQMTGTVILAR